MVKDSFLTHLQYFSHPLLIFLSYRLRMLFSFYNLSDGALFEPSDEQDVETIIELLDIKYGQKVADLGSGDGRIVIAMAQKGALSYGFEKNPDLVDRARRNIRSARVADRAFIINNSFWEADLSTFKKITIFQYYTVMERLENKLLSELPFGALVASNHWTFPHWQPVKQIRDIYLYRKTSAIV